MRDQNIVVYSCGEHSNKYELNEDVRVRPGIHPFYKKEIDKLLSDEANKRPYTILKILLKRFNDGCPGYHESIPQPRIQQIRNYKQRYAGLNVGGNEEYDQVSKQIKDLEWSESSDDKKAFSYGTRMGIGWLLINKLVLNK